VWAYNLEFEEGQIPLKIGAYSGQLFIRVVGAQKKEQKVCKSCSIDSKKKHILNA
jgi:hypothetical protein